MGFEAGCSSNSFNVTFCQCVRLVANDGCPTCMRVCMCPVRQFNVQLYVEKVFIAQKTSEDRGGKVRKRVKDMELLVGLLEKELGGEGGMESREKEQRIYAVAKTHRQTG